MSDTTDVFGRSIPVSCTATFQCLKWGKCAHSVPRHALIIFKMTFKRGKKQIQKCSVRSVMNENEWVKKGILSGSIQPGKYNMWIRNDRDHSSSVGRPSTMVVGLITGSRCKKFIS